MASVDSPAVARRRVRLALREAREAMNLTQGQVAEAMEWSLSKVMRIESGEVTITANDLRPLLAYLGITDRARIDELVQDARVSRRRQMWWDAPQLREHLTPAMRQLIQYESEADAVRHFYMTIFPGRLQTAEYAEAILRSYGDELRDDDRKVRLEVRLRRQQELLARKDPPEIFVLLDESVLYRQVGGARVIGEQLRYLVRLVEQQRVRTRIMPFTVDAPPPLFGSYEIINLSDDDAVMYRESYIVDEIVEDKAKIDRHRAIFDSLWDAALDEATSIRLVAERAESALSSVGDESPG
ncbi:helix-turn-helix domain-containing protein [Planosporangium sp. 12N6]|uniref:helix-turn-helix domain-containing protein n=1 Tax=Planosporangium spinosum TaxID=3402278 RepID=UPI003CF88A8B